jgi:hypothetical protein
LTVVSQIEVKKPLLAQFLYQLVVVLHVSGIIIAFFDMLIRPDWWYNIWFNGNVLFSLHVRSVIPVLIVSLFYWMSFHSVLKNLLMLGFYYGVHETIFSSFFFVKFGIPAPNTVFYDWAAIWFGGVIIFFLVRKKWLRNNLKGKIPIAKLAIASFLLYMVIYTFFFGMPMPTNLYFTGAVNSATNFQFAPILADYLYNYLFALMWLAMTRVNLKFVWRPFLH